MIDNVAEVDYSRFVWQPGDVEVIAASPSDLLTRLQKVSTAQEAKDILPEADQFLMDSQDILLSSQVRLEADRVRALSAA